MFTCRSIYPSIRPFGCLDSLSGYFRIMSVYIVQTIGLDCADELPGLSSQSAWTVCLSGRNCHPVIQTIFLVILNVRVAI